MMKVKVQSMVELRKLPKPQSKPETTQEPYRDVNDITHHEELTGISEESNHEDSIPSPQKKFKTTGKVEQGSEYKGT